MIKRREVLALAFARVASLLRSRWDGEETRRRGEERGRRAAALGRYGAVVSVQGAGSPTQVPKEKGKSQIASTGARCVEAEAEAEAKARENTGKLLYLAGGESSRCLRRRDGWVGNGRLRRGEARRGEARQRIERARGCCLVWRPVFLIYRRALKKSNQVCMHPSIHVKVQITPCPKKPKPPTTDMHRWALSMPCTMRQVSFSPLLCKRTEQLLHRIVQYGEDVSYYKHGHRELAEAAC